MTTRNGSPSPDPPTCSCPKCTTEHPAITYMNVAQVAKFCGYSVATIHSYKSRHILPPAAGRKGGSPRWLSCDIGRWMAGEPSEARAVGRAPGRRGTE